MNRYNSIGDGLSNSVIVEEFRELGLSSYEAKSYLSLLEKDTLSVTEVSRLAGIPRANAYEALEKLLAKGFCIARPGRIKQYSALDPSLLEEKAIPALDNHFEGQLDKLHAKRDEVLTEKKAALERLAGLTNELSPLYRNSRSNANPLEYIEIIKNPHQVHKRFMELVEQSKEDIIGFSKPPYFGTRKQREEQLEQQADLCERKVIKHRGIHEIPKTKEEVRWRLETLIRTTISGNDQTRVIRELPLKMMIFDGGIAMLPLVDPVSTGASFTALIIEHPALAMTLKICFETLWEQAEDYHALEALLKKM